MPAQTLEFGADLEPYHPVITLFIKLFEYFKHPFLRSERQVDHEHGIGRDIFSNRNILQYVKESLRFGTLAGQGMRITHEAQCQIRFLIEFVDKLKLLNRVLQTVLLDIDATQKEMKGHVIGLQLHRLMQMIDCPVVFASQIVGGSQIHVDLERERV